MENIFFLGCLVISDDVSGENLENCNTVSPARKTCRITKSIEKHMPYHTHSDGASVHCYCIRIRKRPQFVIQNDDQLHIQLVRVGMQQCIIVISFFNNQILC